MATEDVKLPKGKNNSSEETNFKQLNDSLEVKDMKIKKNIKAKI